MATTTLTVGGMTCGACTSAVESGFKGVDGVGNVSVSLVMERAVVMHDPNRITAEKIQEIIEDRGFDAQILNTDLPSPALRKDFDEYELSSDDEPAPSPPRTTVTTLAVEGMTCGACTSAIESGFKNVAGVKHFSVSLLSERAVVEHHPELLSTDQIAEIIEDRGFDARVIETKSPEPVAKSKKKRHEEESSVAVTTVAVEGMTCGACTSAVEGSFKGVDGVLKFNISLLAERAVLTHDTKNLSADKIVELIEDGGFDAKVLSTVFEVSDHSLSNSTAQLRIYGNPDEATAQELQEKLLAFPGVASANLNIATSRLTVSHRPAVTGLRSLVDAVESMGFNALVADNDDNNAQLESLAKTREINEWRRSFRISAIFAVPVFMLGMFLPMCWPAADFGSFELIQGIYLGDVICLILTIPIQFGIGKKFYVSAYKSLKHKSPTMDVLVVTGTTCAFVFSCFAMLVSFLAPPHNRPSTLFDTSTMLITFVSLGRYLENRAKGQTSKALSRLMSLAPSMATIYADPIAAEKAAENWDVTSKGKHSKDNEGDGSAAEEKTIPTELIQVGDIVVLRPGDKIPADGMLVRGESYVDESMVTGEAMPVQKKKGSFMIGGTVNGHGRVDFRVSRAGRDTQLSQIVKLVQEAQTNRAPIQKLVDTLAGYFVPTVITLGTLTFIVWIILSNVLSNPPAIFTMEKSGGKIMVCIKLCISVIVFACPCALGLATPTAVMVGTGVGAEHGILVKGGVALEVSTKVTQVVLDKTGTITYGKMKVANSDHTATWERTTTQKRLWWTLVGLAEMGSEHPVGRAVLAAAKEELGMDLEGTIDGSVGDFKAAVGRGISSMVEPASTRRTRYNVLVGNRTFLAENDIEVPESAIAASEQINQKISPGKSSSSAGTTNIFVAINGQYAGRVSLSDTVKEGAAATISVLKQMGIKTAIVTGDQKSTALVVASMVGISSRNVYAGVSPDQKQEIIHQLQDQGEVVAMVGDGINDSPALATADLGIAMSSGTDVAMEAADVVLMRPNDLMDIPASLHLGRTIFRRIKLNLAWACMYNIIGLPFAMGFFLPFGFHLHPMAAGFAMACSSVSVVVSSLLLKFWRRPSWMEDELMASEKGVTIQRNGGWGLLSRAQSFVGRVASHRTTNTHDYVPLHDMEHETV
ncbi:hypothetical protein MKZ38_000572 [Zalerion maritima]|uniref:P-type Cu(+) transporter n=1 Tax=Zalerion maritima TaxID=339359 RepID=A0AAD5WTN2_9PEZI|nr:hypothetical protein MKZ38_000572 [Zalerion maritima]